MVSPRSFVLALVACALAAGCIGRRDEPADTPMRGGFECGAAGTNTVLIDGTCFCLEGHVIAASGDRCVPADEVPLDDGGTVDPVDAGTPDGGDALRPGTLRGVGTSHGTCAAGCASIGFSCTTTCEPGAGRASYGYYDWDYGWYRETTSVDLATCDARPDATRTDPAGEVRELGEVYCCCDIPETTTITAPRTNDQTCTAVCASAGYAGCADFAEWSGEEANGGALAAYERPETGSITYVVYGCEAVPRREANIAGATRYLSYYDCACYR